MHKTCILTLIEKSTLTGEIKELFIQAVNTQAPSALKSALRKNPQIFIKDSESLLAAAAAALGCLTADVLFITGFHKNDLAPERFEAALAELRAVLFLEREGFSRLSLQRQSDRTSADLAGARGGVNYVFEVRCIRTGTTAGPLACLADNTRGPEKDAVEYLRRKYAKKIRQVNCSRKRTGNKYGGIFFALNPASFSGGPAPLALKNLAAALHRAEGGPAFTHIGLLAGPGGAIYPDWPA